jgi:hypothetical protein
LRVSIGDGGNEQLLRAMRVQANFAEYVPLALLLIVMLELAGGPAWLVHALGASLAGGRLFHAYGVGQVAEPARVRVIGMALTLTALAGAAAALLLSYAWRLPA